MVGCWGASVGAGIAPSGTPQFPDGQRVGDTDGASPDCATLFDDW